MIGVMQLSSLRGVFLVLTAAMLWGTTGTAQSLAPAGLSPLWIGAWRLALAGLFFIALLALRKPGAPSRFALGALPWPAIAGAALCVAVYNLAFFAGVRLSGIAVGTAIALGSGPIWSGLLQAGLGSRAPSGAWWTGTLMAVAGGVLMVVGAGDAGGAPPFSVAGTGLCLLAGLSYAVYATINQHLVTRASTTLVTGMVFITAAALAVPLAWILSGAHGWPVAATTAEFARILAVLVWLGCAATGIAYLCFSQALRHIPAATAVSLALAEPVTAFALAVVVVGERPGLLAGLGLLAVLAGLVLVVRNETRAPRE